MGTNLALFNRIWLLSRQNLIRIQKNQKNMKVKIKSDFLSWWYVIIVKNVSELWAIRRHRSRPCFSIIVHKRAIMDFFLHEIHHLLRLPDHHSHRDLTPHPLPSLQPPEPDLGLCLHAKNSPIIRPQILLNGLGNRPKTAVQRLRSFHSCDQSSK